jgi:hypothetical protein
MKTNVYRVSAGPLLLAVSMLAATIAAPAAHAQVNKCLDASGKVVGYGSQCPPGTRQETTGIRNAPSAPASSSRSIAEQEAEFRKRQIEKQDAEAKAEKSAARREERTRACDSARSYFKTLQSGMRVARTDPNTGERVFLGDGDRAREMATAQRAVDANCR